MITTVARFSLLEVRHNRLPWLAGLLLLVSLLFAQFIGALLLTEHRAIQASVLGSMLRLGLVFLVGLYVVSSLLREQQDRTIDLLLAMDAPRAHYALGKLLAFTASAAALAAVAGIAVLAYADPLAALRWSLSLFCELVLIAALATLLAFTFRNVVTALAALGAIYVAARALGGLQLLIADPISRTGGAAQVASEYFLIGLAWLLPDLWRFTDATWLGHGSGTWADLALVVGQTLVYLPLVIAAALFDLYRRAF